LGQRRGEGFPPWRNHHSIREGVYLESDAVLIGFTIANGRTYSSGDREYDQSGGGVFVKHGKGGVSNCTLTGNWANRAGGGTSFGTSTNCLLSGNSTDLMGGGSYCGTLGNCTLGGNSARYGGGAYAGTLISCIAYGNSVPRGSSGNHLGGDDYLRVLAISNNSPVTIHFDSSSNRAYSLLRRYSLVTGQWAVVHGQSNVPGTGEKDILTDTNDFPTTLYRLRVAIPE